MDLDISNKLKYDGYYIFRDVIPEDKIVKNRSYITKDKVNYKFIEKYNNYIFHTLYKKLNIKLSCSKYRVSNKDNNVDAAGFHRDLMIMKKTKTPDIFTVLSYLDGGIMELIPGSHNIHHMNYLQSLESYFKRKIRINVNPTDILIFHASIIHKGIFYGKQKNRRLIQLFDCIEVSQYKNTSNKILHLPCRYDCDRNFEKFIQMISYNKILIGIVDYISFYNISSGYGYNYNILDKIDDKQIIYFSTDSNRSRLKPKYIGMEMINQYIVKNDIKDLDYKKLFTIRFYCYYTNIVLKIGIMILILVLIIFLSKFFKNK